MGLQQTFRLHTAVLAIRSVDGKRTPVMVPSGALVTSTEALAGLRLIDVDWDGMSVMLFTVDLQSRSVLVRSVRTKAAS